MRVVSVHSFRDGTGKSNLAGNVAAHPAGQGRRVGIVDTDIQSPGIHVLSGLVGSKIDGSLNDHLFGLAYADARFLKDPPSCSGAERVQP